MSARLMCLWMVFAVAGCSAQQRMHAQMAAAKALVSDEEENRLGEQVHDELEKQGIRYVTSTVVTGYVHDIARPIIERAKEARPGIHWHVHVVDDPKSVNAFATPGGHLYVMSGLLHAAESDAEVAGVIAHEAGHVVARHTARQLVALYGLQAVSAMAMGNNPTLVKQVAAALAAKGVLLAYTRSAEKEADMFGVQFASAADYDPQGLITFFEKLHAKQGRMPQVLEWLSDHPPTADRIANIRHLIEKEDLDGGRPDSKRLPAVKSALASPRG